jgi:hypothetical protein
MVMMTYNPQILADDQVILTAKDLVTPATPIPSR